MIDKKSANLLIRSVWAGIFIGIGATALMKITVPIVGSLFFALGLLTIIGLKLNLYTGMVGFLDFSKYKVGLKNLGIVYTGNLIGTFLYGTALSLSDLNITSANILASKFDMICNLPIFHILFAAFMCGVLMYTAVAIWGQPEKAFLNCIVTMLCVSVFILSGFEHCIADMVYLFSGNCEAPIFNQIAFIALVSVGNAAGSIVFHQSKKFFE